MLIQTIGILVPDTIEAKILELHQRKRRDVDGAIDKKYTKMDRGDKLLDDEFKFLIGLSNSI